MRIARWKIPLRNWRPWIVATSGESEGDYRIASSTKIAGDIKDLGLRAMAKGLWREYFQAWNVIVARLRSDPENFGDPFVDLPAMKIRMFLRIVCPLSIAYGVDADRKIVYIKSVQSFPPDSY